MTGGGSESKSVTKLPDWYVKFAKDALTQSQKIAQIGHARYGGPDVAAFNPQQIAGMQGAQNFSNAFAGQAAQQAPMGSPQGLPPPVAQQLMPAQNFGGGIQGYSSGPGFDRAMKNFAKTSPGQAKYISKFAIDPKTGKIAPFYKKMLKTIKETDPFHITYRPDPGGDDDSGGND